MTQDHPTFANPTIREALCEIHFRLPHNQSWEAEWFGQYYLAIQKDFPNLEPVKDPNLRIELTLGRVELAQMGSRIRYRHRERNLLVQLSEGILTVNVLPKYLGWQRMQADINAAWNAFTSVVPNALIQRIGLRYINMLPLASDELPDTWLAANDYAANAALSSEPGFLSRTEVRTRTGCRSIVTVGEGSGDGRQLLLDIDCIQETGDDNPLSLNAATAELHELTWSIFEGFLTPRYRARLEGKEGSSEHNYNH